MKRKLQHIGITIGLSVLLLLFLMLTDPNRLPLPLLTIPFGLVFVISYRLISWLLGRLMAKQPRGKRRFFASALAGLPSFLLILSSINQLTGKDILLFLVFFGSLLLYVGRMNFVQE